MEGIQSKLNDIITISDYKEELYELCRDKAQEFAFLGYEHVSAQDIYHCAQVMIKKNERLHEMVSVIITLQVSQFMNFETMNAYKGIFGEENV